MSTVTQYHLGKKMNTENLISILPSLVKYIPANYIKEQRWFGSKSQDITDLELYDAAIFSHDKRWYALALIRITCKKNEAEMYAIPLAFIKPDSVSYMYGAMTPILKIKSVDGVYAVVDALSDDEFCRLQLDYIKDSVTVGATKGSFNFRKTAAFIEIAGPKLDKCEVTVKRLEAEQSNSSIIYESVFIMKNFRKLSYGISPDLEVPLFLTAKTNFKNIALVAGYIEYIDSSLQASIATLQTFVDNAGDGWSYTLTHLNNLYDFALKQGDVTDSNQSNEDKNIESKIGEFSYHYLKSIYRLGQVTGELHVSLASNKTEPNFAPEETTMADVTLWISRIYYYGVEVISSLKNKSKLFSSPITEQFEIIADNMPFYLGKANELTVLAEEKVWKTRYHNDFHLGQVLKTSNDFIIIDFEGEPARSLEERQQKQSPLKDVAGMVRSFNYALYAAIFSMKLDVDQMIILEIWGRVWEKLVTESYLDGYLAAAGGTGARFLPDSEEAMLRVLSVFQMDKAIYELNYELNNRPGWIEIPLKYLVSLLD